MVSWCSKLFMIWLEIYENNFSNLYLKFWGHGAFLHETRRPRNWGSAGAIYFQYLTPTMVAECLNKLMIWLEIYENCIKNLLNLFKCSEDSPWDHETMRLGVGLGNFWNFLIVFGFYFWPSDHTIMRLGVGLGGFIFNIWVCQRGRDT